MRRTLVAAITLVCANAGAHVAPSVDDNNRYLKLTPQRDRVRLAYTVFFGEVPGARLRPSLDTDRDGAISDVEGQIFAAKVGGEVAAALDVNVDKTQHPIAWAEVAIGLGSPAVRAGSFSVDLIAYFCLPTLGGRHALLLRDRYRLQRPGETEVRIEAMPGVKIETGRIGTANDPSHEYRFVGPGGPLSDDGIDLVFDASDQAPIGGGACNPKPGPAAEPPSGGGFSVSAAIATAFVVLGIVVAWLVRRGKASLRA
jgi:hypothetical protein